MKNKLFTTKKTTSNLETSCVAKNFFLWWISFHSSIIIIIIIGNPNNYYIKLWLLWLKPIGNPNNYYIKLWLSWLKPMSVTLLSLFEKKFAIFSMDQLMFKDV